jgi:hypothetical protein
MCYLVEEEKKSIGTDRWEMLGNVPIRRVAPFNGRVTTKVGVSVEIVDELTH